MSDWLQWGAEQQTGQRKVWVNQAITYHFTGDGTYHQPVSIPDATLGSYRREVPASDLVGVLDININRRDVIFEVSYLEFNGSRRMPESGDMVKWTAQGRECQFTVEQHDEGEPVWYWHDKYMTEVRIHLVTYDVPSQSVMMRDTI